MHDVWRPIDLRLLQDLRFLKVLALGQFAQLANAAPAQGSSGRPEGRPGRFQSARTPPRRGEFSSRSGAGGRFSVVLRIKIRFKAMRQG
jgi:hypothetical protein